ncbi:L-threonylcarbamoyladenylate synthase [Gephyromycinifex aptenodytis]|uniref:L-threonylcarbamoyladenylate synthase n=1 Tax=Gephyromycinifex aptenodytis TaxID=2716227 RepID=UPI001446A633|nr:L-threonylcarbamoyladenylate synthase [Gephyromycinifex aptenodytis]
MSPVIDCTDEEGREGGIAAAAAALRAGQLVVLPTDTVYGVAADAFDEDAVGALLAAKGRGREMPPPVLVPSKRTVDGLATQVPAYAKRLIEAFWPGALTIIVRAQASLMWDLGETNGTVALRMPDDELALLVLSETGPLAVTSANRTGSPAARTVVEAATQLGPAVEVYLDGGPSAGGQASTIVDCTGTEPIVLRHGAIPDEELFAALEDPPEPVDESLSESPAPAPDELRPSADPVAHDAPSPASEPSDEASGPGQER